MNASQVRAKVRTAVKRREDEIEAEEVEGGELNLIPYLDIVTNLMLFLLAISAAGMVLGQIDTTLPDHVKSSSTTPVDPKKDPEERLQMVVSVTQEQIIVWSISGLEGTVEDPRATIPRAPAAKGEAPSYDYRKLNDALYEIASRRWKGKIRPLQSYEVILMADGLIPYETIIDVMDTLRRKIPAGEKPGQIAQVKAPLVSKDSQGEGAEYVPVENYNPDEHYLFGAGKFPVKDPAEGEQKDVSAGGILFSRGFE